VDLAVRERAGATLAVDDVALGIELPVPPEVAHCGVPGLHGSPALQEHDARPSLGEAKRREESRGSGADDDGPECRRTRRRSDTNLAVSILVAFAPATHARDPAREDGLLVTDLDAVVRDPARGSSPS